MFLLLLLLVIQNEYKTVHTITISEVSYLQDNFFASLRNDPRLQGDVLTKEKKEFIDVQIDNFIRLTKRSQGIKKTGRQKRSFPIDEIESLSRDKYGVYKLDSVQEKYRLGTEFAMDIVLFEQSSVVYAAALESDEDEVYASKLRLYRKFGDSFGMIHELDVNKALRLSVHATLKGSFIAVAENRSQEDSKTDLYILQADGTLEEVQMLNANYVSDIIIWEQNEELFMAACQQMQVAPNQTTYETTTLVYKWLGGHFDIISQLNTYNAQKLAAFQVGNAHFLAVANGRNDRGESDIFSEIFKYDLDAQTFLPHQRIATKSARDIKFFGFVVENFRETFLVVANYFDEECNENASSVVYKYVDDYFIPFQSIEVGGATGWLPVAGPNGEFVLLASSLSNGIKIFQYDGWRFVDSDVQYSQGVFGPGVMSMHTFTYDNQVHIVVANQNNDGQFEEVVQLNFVHQNELEEYHEKTLSWCKSALNSLHMEELQREIVGQPDRSDMPDSDLSPSEMFGEWQQFNSSDEDFEARITKVQSDMDTQNVVLQNLNVALLEVERHTFTGDVFARSVIVNNAVDVEHLFTQRLNNESMHDFVADVLKLSGFHTEDPLYFSDLTVLDSLNSTLINRKPLETLLHTTDDLKLTKLDISGAATFQAPVKIHGQMNNVNITTQSILLKQGDQYLPGQLKAAEIKVKNLETPQINKMDLTLLHSLSMKPLKLENIANLTVQRLTLMGVLNGADITLIDEFALKTHGDQEISAQFSFDTLEVNDFKTKLPKADDFVRVDSGEYWVRHDVLYTDDVTATSVKIKNSLNNIRANNKGQLDVLLKNSSEVQYINGFKEIAKIKLGDVKFRGKILSKLLEKVNPVKHITKPLNVKANYVFNKGVIVEKLLQTKDIVNTDATVSVERLHHEGVRIHENVIPTHLNFFQQIKVSNVNTTKVNGRNVKDFVVTGTDELQIINGTKFIPRDFFVNGSTEALNINNVNLKELATTTVRIQGNQVLAGKFVIENLTAHGINTSIAQMGEKFWSNVIITDQDQIVTGRTVLNNLLANHFESTSLYCDGSINNFNFTEIAFDTVRYSNIINMISQKRFINLTIDKLAVEESAEFEEHSDAVQLFENAVLPFVEVENITFDGVFNGMTPKAFQEMWFLHLNHDVNFENVTVYGALQVDSDYINHLKIEDLVHKTVKRDETFHFESATFDNVLYSAKPLLLKGKWEGVNLDELSSDRNTKEQQKARVFNEIKVNGSVFFRGLVAGFNVTELCSFANGHNENKKLLIEGNAHIEHNVKTQFVNKFDMNKIENEAWFRNKPARITGSTTFDEIHFSSDVFCSSYVGGIRLKYLADNYFSRTADQTISASLEFVDLVFQNGVKAPALELRGDLNDLELKEFLATTLLDGVEQVFEQTVYFDECTIKGDLRGEYLVNDLDLRTEVMRYDKENIVTGSKILQDVKVDALKADNRINIQDVPLDYWIKNSVLKSGSFNVTGWKTFNGPIEFKKGMHVHGPFNGVFVDRNHTMLKSLSQTISGRKTFAQTGQVLVHFKNIYLSGKLNGFDLREMIENQVYKYEDSVISAVNFNKNLSAVNVYFDKLYNGINVTEFVKKVTHFAEFNNIEVAFQNLLNVAYSVEESLKGQAYYLSTYKPVKKFYYRTHDVVPILFADGVHRLAAIYKMNGTSTVQFYVWNQNARTFEKTSQKMQYLVDPLYSTALKYLEGDYFYIEGYNHANNEYDAIMTKFTNDTSFTYTEFQTEQARSVDAFTLPYSGQKCVVAAFSSELPPAVVCNIYSSVPEVLTIDSTGAVKAIATTIDNEQYIVTINVDLQREEPSVNLWKYDGARRHFFSAQTMYVAQPNDVSAIFYKGGYYIAISSGHVPNTMYSGSIEIYRYDSTTKQFGLHQSIQLSAPIQVEFAVLPSQELVLFALTESSTEPLVIFEYQGISGFTRKIVASGIGRSVSMRHFTTADRKHFVILRLVSDVILVLEAIFKGQQ